MTKAGLFASVASIALILAAVPAYADDGPDDSGEVAAIVAEAAPTSLESAPIVQAPDSAIASLESGGEVSIANEPDEGVAVTSTQGVQLLDVTLPGAHALGAGEIAEDGSVTYPGSEGVPAVNVLAADHSLRLSVVIADAGEPTRYDYDLGEGVSIEINSDGSATAVALDTINDPQTGAKSQVERIVGDVQAPWAVDASGANIPTHYEAHGSVLTQVVDHAVSSAHYPVVADPTFDQPNIFQYRIRFNRAETATIASGGAGVIASLGCGAMLPVCVLAGGTIWWNASVANNSNPKKCVQITATQTYVTAGLIWWVDQYRGGPCR